MTQSFWIGIAAITFAVVAWGIQLPVAKDAFDTVDPYHLTSIRYAGAVIFLAAMLAYREGLAALSFDGHLISLSALGVVGMCLSPMLVFIGMSMSVAEHAVIIVSLQPTVTAAALWLLGRQRPNIFTLICVAVALLGVILVVTKGKFSFAGSTRELIGDLIVFAGAISWVVYSLGAAKFARFSTWRLSVLTMFPGSLATVLITVLMIQFGGLTPPGMSEYRSVAIEIAYLTIVGVIVAILAWNFGLRRVGAQNATLLINLMPVTAFAYRSWQGVRFEAIELIGVALVVTALVANNLMQRYQQIRLAGLN
ncbi:MAG: DMT family transporter [Gammaproteobacteria bacterium]